MLSVKYGGACAIFMLIGGTVLAAIIVLVLQTDFEKKTISRSIQSANITAYASTTDSIDHRLQKGARQIAEEYRAERREMLQSFRMLQTSAVQSMMRYVENKVSEIVQFARQKIQNMIDVPSKLRRGNVPTATTTP